MEPLDNPVWHALCGPQATLAEGSGGALRYRREFTPFAALGDAEDPRAWHALADVVGPGAGALLVTEVAPLAGWELLGSFAVFQMVLDSAVADVTRPDGCTVDALDENDVPAMTTLVSATEPGPWAARTHELGEFLGVHVQGRLVAMAGQRMHLDDATEISAVCTDADHRGLGYARAAVAAITSRTLATGRRPFLHVRVDNPNAVHLYERLGYRIRTTLRPGLYRSSAP